MVENSFHFLFSVIANIGTGKYGFKLYVLSKDDTGAEAIEVNVLETEVTTLEYVVTGADRTLT